MHHHHLLKRLLFTSLVRVLVISTVGCIGRREEIDPIGAFGQSWHLGSAHAKATTNGSFGQSWKARHPSSLQKTSYVLASDGFLSATQLLIGASFEIQEGFVDVEGPSESNNNFSKTQVKQNSGARSETKQEQFLACPPSMRDFISCEESFSGESKPCEPAAAKDHHCFVDAPTSYTRPFPWPQCQNQVRAQNVPSVPLLHDKKSKAWLKLEGNLISFLPTGPSSGQNVDEYIEYLSKLAPSLKFGTHTRLVLDIGGRTGSLSAAFEKRGVLTLTITDRESAQNGVQLILERGFSGLVQTLRAHRLPYPDQAFDLLHCADCSISWPDNGGLLLFEADRLVRAGGFIVLVNARSQSHHWTGLMRLTMSICWELTAREGNLMIWQKPANKTCYLLHSATISHACDDDLNPSNAVWNASLTHCLVGSSTKKIEAVVDTWPARLISPPLRLQYVPTASIQKAKQESYLADFNYWQYVTSFYLKSFGTSRMRGIRNVIDMNAGYGGLAAALSLESSSKHWWILNVVPITGPDRLPVVFDRGLLGVYHNWCKALDIYPRTFDMLHASALFSTKLGCDMSEILFEMDRLLRPGGFALIRDKIETILQFDAIAKMLEWKTTISDTESGPMGTDKLLHCQKSFHSRRSQKRG